MIDSRIGPYRIVRKLGEGGMGSVYEGLPDGSERPVAIKVLRKEYSQSAEYTERFFQEARAINQVDHPGLVHIRDVGQLPGGAAYIVMELLRGEQLGNRIKRVAGPMAVSLVVSTAQQIASALAAAHEKGVVHRDLKPDHVMMVPDAAAPGGERAKLLAFGIVKTAPVQTSATPTAATAGIDLAPVPAVLGTPAYMSPEQCERLEPIDSKSDVYSLGVMLFVMLSGKRPFTGVGAAEIMAKHIHEPPPQLQRLCKTLPPALAVLVHRLLAKHQSDRPSMLEVQHELDELGLLLGPPPPSAGSMRASALSAASQMTPPPSGASVRGYAPSGASVRGHAPSGASVRGYAPSAASVRALAPSAASMRTPVPSAVSMRTPAPSAVSMRTPAPSAASLREPGPGPGPEIDPEESPHATPENVEAVHQPSTQRRSLEYATESPDPSGVMIAGRKAGLAMVIAIVVVVCLLEAQPWRRAAPPPSPPRPPASGQTAGAQTALATGPLPGAGTGGALQEADGGSSVELKPGEPPKSKVNKPAKAERKRKGRHP